MPNSIDPFSTQRTITHDPMATVRKFDFGGEENPYAQMTEAIIFGAVNETLGWIDDVTGLDLLALAQMLEPIVGSGINLLTGFVGWLTPTLFETGANVFSGLFSAFGVDSLGHLNQVWGNLLGAFGAGVTILSDLAFDASAFLLGWVNDLLFPLGIIAQIGVDGLLIAAQAPQLLWDTIFSINDVWTGLVTALNPVTWISAAIGGIFGTGQAAVAVNSIQDAKLNALMVGPGGVSIYDAFSGAAAYTLDPANWAQIGFGAGSGNYGVDGSGNAAWYAAGASPYSFQNIFIGGETLTDTQAVAITQANDFYLGFNAANEPAVRLQLRENLAGTERVEAYSDPLGCEIGYVLAGSYTRLGAPVAYSGYVSTAGQWQLSAGTDVTAGGDDREFVLYKDGVEFCRRTDSSGLSAMGASNRHQGYTVTAGENINVFGFLYQVPPPLITSFAAADREPNT